MGNDAAQNETKLPMAVKVAVEGLIYSVDKLYTYLLPSELQTKALLGTCVLVPFGSHNKKREGVIFELIYNLEESNNLKEIVSILDDKKSLNEEQIKLSYYMKKKYFCTFFDALKCMMPAGSRVNLKEVFLVNEAFTKNELFTDIQNQIINYIKIAKKPVSKNQIMKNCMLRNDTQIKKLLNAGALKKQEEMLKGIKDLKVKMVRLATINCENLKLTSRQKEVVDLLLQSKKEMSVKEVLYLTGVSAGVVDLLVKKKVLEVFKLTAFKNPYNEVNIKVPVQDTILTEGQQKSYESIYNQYLKGEFSVSLLYGITGSGKTSVFMKLIDKVNQDGKSVIVMVPEISLTPQMISLFKARYHDKVAVIHSGLSSRERFCEFKRIENQNATIVIGTRSAVFAPVSNLGLIVMDEEQEHTYKSESTPRYHARDIAKFRCYYHQAELLLSSATPSVESFFMAQQGKYAFSELKCRYGNAKLPKVTVVDMNEETNTGNFSGFSDVLLQQLNENLLKKEQSILLLNRRGYNTFASCRECGQVVLCPNCSISMTYHSANGRLMCHYCGRSIKVMDECPVCHKHSIKFSGTGTQKVEETLKTLLPQAKILRMDTDSIIEKFSYEKKLEEFSNGEYDILLGTQMVAKGLDFPNVTLVGVLSVDQTLYNDDFRSYEKAFSLLTQVVGRSGRADKSGRAIIQTFTPENSVIKMAAEQNYDLFYNGEIKIRKAMLYPPFSKLCVIGFTGNSEEKVKKVATDFFKMLKQIAQSEYTTMPIRAIGPSGAKVLKVSNKYRYKIIMKYKGEENFIAFLDKLLIKFEKEKKHSNISLFVDINPCAII